MMSGARLWVFLLVVAALLAAACGGSDVSGSDDSDGSGLEPVGAGVLTVDGVDYDFEVFTCDLDGYENEGVEYDFDVAGIGSKEVAPTTSSRDVAISLRTISGSR